MTFWQSLLMTFGFKKYRPVWVTLSHAYRYLDRQFASLASYQARGRLLPEQEEALAILSGPFPDGWIEVEP